MNDVRININDLHPHLRYKLKRLLKLCEKNNLPLIITEGFRTVQRQDEIYAQGRTKPGIIVTQARGKDYQSQHQWGVAFDIAINIKGKEYDMGYIRKVANLAKSENIGLYWGGDWTDFVDNLHFYLKKWGSTTYKLRKKYVTPDNFKKEWTAFVKRKKGLNIYKKDKKTVLKHLDYGTKVQVMFKGIYWAKIECNGTVGYLRKKYLR